jgi:hypothetical protein
VLLRSGRSVNEADGNSDASDQEEDRGQDMLPAVPQKDRKGEHEADCADRHQRQHVPVEMLLEKAH